MVDFIQGHHHFSSESVIKQLNQIENVSTVGTVISSMIGPGSEVQNIWFGL